MATSSKMTSVRGPRAVFGCTHEALALYRISLGVLLTLELVLRFRFLHPFYSDEGTLPLRLLLPKIDDLYKAVCLHCHVGDMLSLQIVLSIQVIAAFFFTIGFQTRIMTVVSWYLYLSLTLRNTWLNFILDRYFHYLLFYAIFLPCGQCWSVDSRKDGQKKSALVVSPATIGLKVLVFWLYLDAGGGKYLDPLEGWSYNAKPLPALDTYTRHTAVARYMYALMGPGGLRAMTPMVVYVELFAAPVAFLGAYLGSPIIINTAVALIWQLHVGIALCVNNAFLLSLVACSVWCIFLPIGWEDTKSNNTSGFSSPVGTLVSVVFVLVMVGGSIWFETTSASCDQPISIFYSTIFHCRWNVFTGAEQYVTWEIAPGQLADGSIVDIWGRKEKVDWNLPGAGAPCTSTARPGRWRSFPYLAELEGEDGAALWGYLCNEWDRENDVDRFPERNLIKFNFFMLQADVLPNMAFSATRKRLIHSHECVPGTGNNDSEATDREAVKSDEESEQTAPKSSEGDTVKEDL